MAPPGAGLVRQLTNLAVTGHSGPQPWESVKKHTGKLGWKAQQTFDRTQIFDEYDVGDIYNEEQILRLQDDWIVNMYVCLSFRKSERRTVRAARRRLTRK